MPVALEMGNRLKVSEDLPLALFSALKRGVKEQGLDSLEFGTSTFEFAVAKVRASGNCPLSFDNHQNFDRQQHKRYAVRSPDVDAVPTHGKEF